MSQLSRLLVAREIKQVIGGAFFLIHPVGANMSKKPWDRAQIMLRIVFIHENVQFGTGPILLNKMGPVP